MKMSKFKSIKMFMVLLLAVIPIFDLIANSSVRNNKNAAYRAAAGRLRSNYLLTIVYELFSLSG